MLTGGTLGYIEIDKQDEGMRNNFGDDEIKK